MATTGPLSSHIEVPEGGDADNPHESPSTPNSENGFIDPTSDQDLEMEQNGNHHYGTIPLVIITDPATSSTDSPTNDEHGLYTYPDQSLFDDSESDHRSIDEVFPLDVIDKINQDKGSSAESEEGRGSSHRTNWDAPHTVIIEHGTMSPEDRKLLRMSLDAYRILFRRVEMAERRELDADVATRALLITNAIFIVLALIGIACGPAVVNLLRGICA